MASLHELLINAAFQEISDSSADHIGGCMTDTEGTGNGCACVHFDALECSRRRYGRIDRFDYSEIDDACECLCHKWEPDEDDAD